MSSEIRRQRLDCVGLEKGKKFHGSQFQEAGDPCLSAPAAAAAACNSCPPACSGQCKACSAGGLGDDLEGARHSSTCKSSGSMAGILGRPAGDFFLCFRCAAAAGVACSFAGASLARVVLGSGVSRTSAGCARGFYNPPQRRHREGAVPGLRTRQSPRAAPRLNRRLATVSPAHAATPRLSRLPAVGVFKPGAPRAPRSARGR